MAKYKSWEDIDRDSHGMVTNLTYTVLFINDQIYNYSLILLEQIRKTKLYRHKVKKLCNEIVRATENYNYTLGGANITTINKTSLAVITASIEEDVEKHIKLYQFTLSQILLGKGIEGERNIIASVSSTLNMLAQMSELTIKDFGRFARSYNVSGNPLSILSLNGIEQKSDEISNIIIGNVKVNLNEYPEVMVAFKGIANNLLKAEVFNKAFEEAEKFIKDEDKYSVSMG